MGTLSNTPQQPVMMTLAARKSFSFTVQFLDTNGLPLDLTDATASFTIGEQQYSTTPILTQQATDALDSTGIALFDLQASQLDLTPGIYPFEVVTVAAGYSAIAINGELEIAESYEMGSLSQSYVESPSSYGLVARLKNNRLVVTSNSLVLQGPVGPEGPEGVNGNPFGQVLVEYDVEGRISSLTVGGETTTYSYNVDDTIAFDQRNGLTRVYNYTDGLLTSIELTGS